MAGRGGPFSQEFPTGDSFETSIPQIPTPKEKGTGYLYPIYNKVVDDLRIITKAYAMNIGGLPIILAFPRREFRNVDVFVTS